MSASKFLYMKNSKMELSVLKYSLLLKAAQKPIYWNEIVNNFYAWEKWVTGNLSNISVLHHKILHFWYHTKDMRPNPSISSASKAVLTYCHVSHKKKKASKLYFSKTTTYKQISQGTPKLNV